LLSGTKSLTPQLRIPPAPQQLGHIRPQQSHTN